MSTENFNILIVVPSGTHWLAEFGVSLISMLGYFSNTRIGASKVQQYQLANVRGSILPNSRLKGLKAAKEVNATHLLYLDSDHTFPPDTLNRLLKHGKDCVAANCVTKTIPAMTTARKYSETNKQGTVVFSDLESTGLEKVWRVGTGVMLLSRRLFSKIPHDSFAMSYKSLDDTYQGEDWALCEAIEYEGCPIYIDHKLSREIGHIGSFIYTHDYVGTIIKEPLDE
jgi:hypothetical protein